MLGSTKMKNFYLFSCETSKPHEPSTTFLTCATAAVSCRSQTGLLGYQDIKLMTNSDWLKQLPFLVLVSGLGMAPP